MRSFVLFNNPAQIKMDNHSQARKQTTTHDNAIEDVEETTMVMLVDVDKHMYMSGAPNPDIIIQTAGENRVQFPSLADRPQHVVCPCRTMAGDWSVALGLGNNKLPHISLLFGKEKEASLGLPYPQ
ncbi:hypothetical protein Dsin_020068 [Dipteronia sinensis]|uniref:Uncharacterized protein n=1 Tax=Dipteronia sinensis TaxID=43782 RepID=A0AAE0E350_9ROSI|nr:hypothetical protein Dsin_020068 [Dipteronia sinensis]